MGESTRGPLGAPGTDDLVSALVDVRFGEFTESENRPALLEMFASAIPELLDSRRVSGSVIIGHLDHAVSAELHDIVLVSRDRVHFAQRLPHDPRVALVSVAPRTRSVGLIISEARTRIARD